MARIGFWNWKVMMRILLGVAIGLVSVALCNAVDYELTDGMRYTPPIQPPMRIASQFLNSIFGDALWIVIPLVLIGIIIIIDTICSIILKKRLYNYSLITLVTCVVIFIIAAVVQDAI